MVLTMQSLNICQLVKTFDLGWASIVDLQMLISDRAAAALGVPRRGGPGSGEEALQLRDPRSSYLEIPQHRLDSYTTRVRARINEP